MKILVINAGSSSLKFRLFEMPGEQVLCSGIVERIGEKEASIHFTRFPGGEDQTIEQPLSLADHSAAMQQVILLLSDADHGVIQDPSAVELVGHRVVHGGETFSSATIVTPEVKEKIKALFPFAPLHNPVNFRCLEVAADFFPNAKQVAVFDTAFHHELPPEAAQYALPCSYYKQDKIRVYGFHGISHKYVTEQAREFLGLPQAKLISLHLGNGCSVAAVEGDRSRDTSMGFSPVSGLVMGTRSGDIDPSVLLHLMTHHGYSVEYIDNLLNKQSGLQGLTGYHDMRDVDKAAEEGDTAAQFARRLYAYRIKKYIGSYTAVLNGLDGLIFTGGVGEHDYNMRTLVCDGLSHLGIEIDGVLNALPTTRIRAIHSGMKPVKVLVIPTNEELEIARQCMGIAARL